MTEDQTLSLVTAIGCLVLVASSLAVRRMPVGAFWRMAAIWTLIFAGLFLMLRLFPSIVANFT